jgi:gamma-glutamyltranspeptidase
LKADTVSRNLGRRRDHVNHRLDPWKFQSAHTTHVCAVDRERNAVSVTLTLGNLLGSHVVVPGTGAPSLLLDRGRLRAVIGTPGGRRIPTAIAQVIVNLIDRGLGMQDAIAAPRLHAEGPEVPLDDRIDPTVSRGCGRWAITSWRARRRRARSTSRSPTASPSGPTARCTAARIRSRRPPRSASSRE